MTRQFQALGLYLWQLDKHQLGQASTCYNTQLPPTTMSLHGEIHYETPPTGHTRQHTSATNYNVASR